MSYDVLFEPITIGDMTLKNRIAVAPMNVGYTDPNGYSGTTSLAYYATRVRGGFGLIITEANLVNPHRWCGADGMNVKRFTDYRSYRFWSEIVTTVHGYDSCRICIQLSPGWGRQGHSSAETPDVPAGTPSPIPLCMDLRDYFQKSKGYTDQAKKWMPKEHCDNIPIDDLIEMSDEEFFAEDFQTLLKDSMVEIQPELYHKVWGEVPRALTIPEIVDLEDRMAEQARAAFSLDFDAVEVHSPHGYLIHQFLSPKMNHRRDEYGGCLENRARFLINIIKKIRKKIGPDKPVLCRLSGDELQPGGITHEEQCQVAAWAKEAGCSAINVSQGSYESIGSALAPDGEDDYTRWAAGFKKASDLPIIVPSFLTAECAQTAIKEKSVDIVELGRQSLADPFWPVKVRTGREKDIIKCIRCNQCYVDFAANRWLTCKMNPMTGKEKFFPDLWMDNSKLGSRLKKVIRKAEGLPQIQL